MELFHVFKIGAFFTIALIIGGMVFFATIMTPLVFSKLPPEISGPFIREVFPVYSKVMAVLSFFAVVFLWDKKYEAIALATVFVLFIWAWIWLMPKINKFRDEELGGNKGAAKRFNFLHKLSVAVNLTQLAAVAIVFFKMIA